MSTLNLQPEPLCAECSNFVRYHDEHSEEYHVDGVLDETRCPSNCITFLCSNKQCPHDELFLNRAWSTE